MLLTGIPCRRAERHHLSGRNGLFSHAHQPQVDSSMDGFCMALLSSEERRHLDTLAMQTSDAFEVLGKILQSGNNRLDELPGMLLEAFIHTL